MMVERNKDTQSAMAGNPGKTRPIKDNSVADDKNSVLSEDMLSSLVNDEVNVAPPEGLEKQKTKPEIKTIMDNAQSLDEFEEHLQKCLSMVLHYDIVQSIADVFLKIKKESAR